MHEKNTKNVYVLTLRKWAIVLFFIKMDNNNRKSDFLNVYAYVIKLRFELRQLKYTKDKGANEKIS